VRFDGAPPPLLVRALARLVNRYGRSIVAAALAATPDPRPRGRPNVTCGRNLTIYRTLVRRPDMTITEAVREVMPGAEQETVKAAVKKFDGFSFDDPRRGFDRGQFYAPDPEG
jgi:hypothetical protein